MMIVQHQGGQPMDGMRVYLCSDEQLRCLNDKRKSGSTNPHRCGPEQLAQHLDRRDLRITPQIDRILH